MARLAKKNIFHCLEMKIPQKDPSIPSISSRNHPVHVFFVEPPNLKNLVFINTLQETDQKKNHGKPSGNSINLQPKTNPHLLRFGPQAVRQMETGGAGRPQFTWELPSKNDKMLNPIWTEIHALKKSWIDLFFRCDWFCSCVFGNNIVIYICCYLFKKVLDKITMAQLLKKPPQTPGSLGTHTVTKDLWWFT